MTGEAETVFPRVLERVLDGRCPGGLPGVAVRGRVGLSPFAAVEPADFALTTYPSPYLAGLVAVDPNRATYVETVRGCRSHCTFCFYPRSSAVLRALDVTSTRELITALAERGAREVVFLDPTFNHRPGFEELLEAIRDVNRGGALKFFAEVRAEGLTERHADQLAAAGFYKLEIGLQSVNPIALAKSKRGGNKDLVLKAAKMLEARGIDLLIDLIVGLPGDAKEHVIAGIDFLAEHRLGRYAQVFPLQVLPGTAMRATAREDGIEFDERPPYRVIRTATLDEDEITELLEIAEERLDRCLDETPRPFLCDPDPIPTPVPIRSIAPPDVFVLDCDAKETGVDTSVLGRPGAAHVSLWVTGRDLWAARDRIAAAIRSRIATDPYSILDVVLAPDRPCPTDVLDVVLSELSAEPAGYASRSGIFQDEDRGRRVSIVLRKGREFPSDWIEAMHALAPVYREMSADEAFARGSRLGTSEPGARVMGPIPDTIDTLLQAFRVLCAENAVVFADRAIERRFADADHEAVATP